ncbi:MAG: hypothetical protein QOE36_3148, partial [Gaiellaceae bacterium]|nr:hypothetical protein [Gaiellaceae bacterium]
AGGRAAAVLAVLQAVHFPVGARATAATGPDLTVVLRNGVDLRLGDSGDLRLKLAIARRALPFAAAADASGGKAYLDVSVPQRPVSGVQQPSSRR